MARTRLILDVLAPRQRHRYGPHRSQRADLYLPRRPGPHPVMVLIHGGSWQVRYGKIVMRGLAGDLMRRGWAVWNIEYRRVGDGGGWPETFEDVAAAIDHLATLDAPVDLERVSILGHSAGGHLALWAAGRAKLPAGAPGTPAPIRVRRVISQAGVCDLADGYHRVPEGAVKSLMGGGPEEFPERYAIADPMAHVPLGIPVLLVHGTADETVSVELSRKYESAERAAGGTVELVEIEGEAGRHRAHIDPRGEAWAAVTSRLGGYMRSDRLPAKSPRPHPSRAAPESSRLSAGPRLEADLGAVASQLDQQAHAVAGGAFGCIGAPEVPGRPGDVQVHPRRVPDEVRQERRACDRASLAPFGGVVEIAVFTLDQLVVLLVQRQPPHDLAGPLAGIGHLGGKGIVI